MIVILLKDIKGTGKAGDVVKVNDGYARNMLIPKGLAQIATDSNMRSLEKAKALQDEKYNKDKEEAMKLKDNLEKLRLIIETKAGEGGRLFGSITSMDIQKVLLENHKIDIDKKKIQLESPIKQAGNYELNVKLFYDVIAKLKVSVTA